MMRASIDAAALARAVKVTAAAITTRPVMPVLAGVLIDADDDLTFSTFDMDASAVATAPAVVAEPGRTLVSHRLLAQISASCKSGDVVLTLDHRGLTVTSGRATWRLPLLRLEDYPDRPTLDGVMATVDADEFAEAVERVSAAAGVEAELTQPFDVVQLANGPEGLQLASFDRYRLHTALVAAKGGSTDGFVLVPAQRLAAMVKRLDGGEVTILHSGAMFGLRSERAVFATRTPDSSAGWYKWETLLTAARADPPASATLARTELLAGLRQIAGFAENADAHSRIITLTFEAHGELTIQGGTDADGSGSTVVTTEHEGKGLRLLVNVAWLIDLVNTCTEPTVRLLLGGPRKALGICDGEAPAGSLVMPLIGDGRGAWLDDEAAA